MARLDLNQLKAQAAGRWLSIFQAICPGLFDEAIANLGSHVTCPFHGGENDFRFLKKGYKGRANTNEVGVAMCTCGVYGDGFSVIMRALGAGLPEAMDLVNTYLNGGACAQEPLIPLPVRTKEEDEADQAALQEKVDALWRGGRPLDLNTMPYYMVRGISRIVLKKLQDVRMVASLGYYKKENGKRVKVGSFPALLAAMRNADGKIIAVHRTWLSADRREKAPVLKAKKLSYTPGAAGAAIRLFAADETTTTLGLCEGIETAGGVRQLLRNGFWPEFETQMPIWATYSERNIRNFVIPPMLTGLKRIVIFADHDESGTGLSAAKELQARLKIERPDLEVVIKLPPVPGMDWLDHLLSMQK